VAAPQHHGPQHGHGPQSHGPGPGASSTL
jgi:hypothetical protein